MWSWTLSVVAFAGAVPDAETLRWSWERHRPALDAHAVLPLMFSAEEWADVAAGEVARRRVKLEGTDRVIGLSWIPATQDVTWIAVHDEHNRLTKGYHTVELPGSHVDDTIEYGRMEVPWPFATRHWVVHIVNNGPLREATDGAIWERSWVRDTDTPTEHRSAKGVWLDVNEGGWFYVAAEGGTLLVYHARTVVGGIVPDHLATSWAFGKLDNMLIDIAERTKHVRGHYVASHPPIARPGATLIQTFSP